MEMSGTIRKDSLPKDTVSNVKNILHNLGIETMAVDEHKEKNFSSVRIEVDGFPI